MHIQQIESPSTLTQKIKALKTSGKTIGLVPTMGALHEGHLTLIRKAKAENDIVVCSIFVNPTQFNNKEDLDKYPKNVQKDIELLNTANCDYAFTPQVKQVYEKGEKTRTIDYGNLDKVMEGPNRPGHFDGVVTIVSKLFEICIPNKAYFGEKDYQQLAIIKAMTKQFKFKVEIRPCEIIRNGSGLAMSSRNARLSNKGLLQASEIYACLREAKNLSYSHSIQDIKVRVEDFFKQKNYFQLEYFQLSNAHDLSEANSWTHSDQIIGFIVAHLEGVRLIDNIAFRE